MTQLRHAVLPKGMLRMAIESQARARKKRRRRARTQSAILANLTMPFVFATVEPSIPSFLPENASLVTDADSAMIFESILRKDAEVMLRLSKANAPCSRLMATVLQAGSAALLRATWRKSSTRTAEKNWCS